MKNDYSREEIIQCTSHEVSFRNDKRSRGYLAPIGSSRELKHNLKDVDDTCSFYFSFFSSFL